MRGDSERVHAERGAAISAFLVLTALLGCAGTGAIVSKGSEYYDELYNGAKATGERDYSRALVHYEAAADAAREGDMPPYRLAKPFWGIGISALALGDLERAEAAAQRATEIYTSDPPPFDLAWLQASALVTLGRVYVARREFSKGAELFEQAVRIEKAAPYMQDLAWAYWESGDVDRAIVEATRLVEHLETYTPMMPPGGDATLAHHSLGVFHYYRMDYDACALENQTALTLAREWLEPDDPDLIISLSNGSGCLLELGQYDQAELLLGEALSILENQETPIDHAGLGFYVHANLGLLRTRQGRVEEARKALDKARIAQEMWFAAEPSGRVFEEELRRKASAAYLARVEANLAADQGHRSDAVALYETSLQLYEERFGPSSPHLRIILEDYLGALHAAGAHQRAAGLERRLAAISAQPGGRGAP